MASTTNAVQSLVTNFRFSSLYLSPDKALPSCHLLKNQLSSLSRPSCLSFTSSWDKKEAWIPFEILSAKPLKFTGWNQNMRRRSQVDFSVASAAATDADGSAIEISEVYAKPSKSFADRFLL